MSNLVEMLEARRLMADGALVIDLVRVGELVTMNVTGTGTLVVKGGTADDVLSIRQDGGWLRVKAQGQFEERFSLRRVRRILVEGASGNDRIHVDPAISRAVTLVGGGGNDILEASIGATLVGGDGNDKLVVQSRAWQLVPVTIGEDGETVIPDNVTVDPRSYGGAALLLGGAGDDTLVTGGGADSVVGGTGDDAFISTGALKFVLDTEGKPHVIEGVGELSGVEQIALGPADPRGSVIV